MEKIEYQFEDFLMEVDQEYKDFAVNIHEALLQDGYKAKIESKASGFFISYSHPKTKRSVLNFLFRKKKLLARIYADNHDKYADFIKCLPESMEEEIAKASVCKRLIDPATCNSKCVMGYDFYIKDNQYKKCRYGCFQFEINAESIPVVTAFIDNEKKARLAV